MSLLEWLAYLESIHLRSIDLGLDRVRKVVERVCITQACPVVTIAGTNGKGTTVAALQTLASQQGWRVGVYTSPHLFTFNERIVFDLPDSGACKVSDAVLIDALEVIEAARGDVSLTYFEFTTLAALYIFRQMQLDLVILEVGMGGRLDCTNIVDADIAIITRIALDHMEFLGNTREAIAFEKAGIMRSGKPCIYSGDDLHECMQLLAVSHGATLLSFGQAFEADMLIQQAAQTTNIPVANLACAKKAFELLGGRVHDAMWDHLASKKPVGRFTPVRFGENLVIFDVAHNPDSMRLLSQQIKALPYADIRFIIGMLHEKDHTAALACLKDNPRLTFYVSTPQGTPRAARPAELMAALDGANAFAFETLGAAWHASWENVTHETVWVVTGSFFTVAQVWEEMLCDIL